MKFPKALLNSALCGLFFCFLLTMLVAGLNVNARLSGAFLLRLGLTLAMTYGLAVTVICLAVFFIYDFFSSKKNAISAVSPTFLTVGFSLLTFLFLAVFWMNTRHFRTFLAPRVWTRLNAQKTVLLALGLLGLVAVFLFYRLRKKPVVFGVYALLFALGLAGVVWQRPPTLAVRRADKQSRFEAPRIATRLTLLGLEGLSFDFIVPLLSQGKLPNFTHLVEEGSWGRLAGFTPNEIPVLDASLDTGKLPYKHRRLSAHSYRLRGSRESMEVIPRFIFFNQLARMGLLRAAPAKTAPVLADLWRIFGDCGLSVLRHDRSSPPESRGVDQKAETAFALLFGDLNRETSPLFTPARQAFSLDFRQAEEADRERLRSQPQVFSLMLTGLNTVEKHFYQYSFPDLYSGVDRDAAARFGTVIEKYYQFYDQVIGRYLASLKEDETFIVYSPHGIDPLPFLKRLLGWISGSSGVSADHEQAPDGVIFFFGKNIARAKNIEGCRVIDLAPTLLYSLGLPVGRDMDRIVRSQVFQREFTADNPIFYISSYEDISIRPAN